MLVEDQQELYTVGDELNIKVTSSYDTGYTRDVTDMAKIIGYDANRVGKQNVVVVYTETLHFLFRTFHVFN